MIVALAGRSISVKCFDFDFSVTRNRTQQNTESRASLQKEGSEKPILLALVLRLSICWEGSDYSVATKRKWLPVDLNGRIACQW
jgi:hypothetical protein